MSPNMGLLFPKGEESNPAHPEKLGDDSGGKFAERNDDETEDASVVDALAGLAAAVDRCAGLGSCEAPSGRRSRSACGDAGDKPAVQPGPAVSARRHGSHDRLLCAELPMIPALGQFYGGMVRRKNVLSTFQQSFILLGVIALQWLLVGYSLAFGGDAIGGLCGGWQWFGLSGVGIDPNPSVAPLIPHQLFMLFQMFVAVFAAALISGAIAERVRFSSYLVFTLLWSTLVYDPVAHWVWGPDGWIKKLGALDFGGGLVVHLTSGLAALCCVRVVGKRKGLDHEDLHPHSLTLTALGTGLLWYGWQGLNAGQARSRMPRRSPRSWPPTWPARPRS